MMRISLCPVCNSSQWRSFVERDYQVPFMDDLPTFEYCQCSDCGFVFTGNPLSEEIMHDYYVSPNRWGHVYKNPPIPTQNIWHSQLAFLDKHLPGRDLERVLEPGCGPGYFLKLLSQVWDVSTPVGFEFSPKAISHGRDNLGVDIYEASEASMEEVARKGPYQLVILRHLLEHIPMPGEYLQELLPLLAPTGHLFVETPAQDIMDEKVQQFPVFEHVNYFTLHQMERLLQRLGLESVGHELATYDSASEKPYRVLRVLARPGTGSRLSSPDVRHSSTAFIRLANSSDTLQQALTVITDTFASDADKEQTYAFFSASNETLGLLRSMDAKTKSRVVAIFDNNSTKAGKNLEGVEIRSPEAIHRIRPNKIIIGSSGFQDEIYRELLKRGLSEEDLIILWPEKMEKQS